MKIVGGKVSQGVFNYYKEEQVKKGVKFTQKVLSSLDFLIINGDGWIRDAGNSACGQQTVGRAGRREQAGTPMCGYRGGRTCRTWSTQESL